MRRWWYRLKRFTAQKVLHTQDTAHQIALGAAVGVFIAFLPLMGIQTVLAIAFAAMLRANKVICIPIVWVSNPFTIVPIYGSCWAVGRFVAGSPATPEHPAVLERLASLSDQHSLFDAAFWRELLGILTRLGVELWVGCILVGLAAGLASYFLARHGVTTYRERRRQRILRRQLFRSNLAAKAKPPARTEAVS